MQGVTSVKYEVKDVLVISIHTPYAGSDKKREKKHAFPSVFQSTLPMQGVTIEAALDYAFLVISIHTPYAGSDVKFIVSILFGKISIHTPYAGSDLK